VKRSNHWLATIIVAIVIVGLFFGIQTPMPRVEADPPTLNVASAPSQFDYHDDRDGRNLADVELTLVRRADGLPQE